MCGVIEIMVKNKRKWNEYVRTYLSKKCLYDLNRAKYITACINEGVSDYHVWEVAKEYNLTESKEYLLVDNVWKTMYIYPLSVDFVDACDFLYIPEMVFDRSIVGVCEISERFHRLFSRWDYTIRNFDLYKLQHQAIYGADYEER